MLARLGLPFCAAAVACCAVACCAVARGALACGASPGGAMAAQPAATAVEFELERVPWSTDEVGAGVTWRAARFDALFGAPQSLNVLEVELPPRTRRLRFVAPDPFARVPVSSLAAGGGALAAVNGGFFDTEDGTPAGLLRIGGVTRREQDATRTVAIGVDRRERVTVEERGPGDWSDVLHARGSWPLIVRDGRPVRRDGWGARDRRHPRTAAGLRRDRVLVLVTVDGRTARAAGMTLLELAETMRALGCTTAMNLDGGGSTTMWIRGRGVVNFPCDNSRYDHAGERAVGDAVLILAPVIVRLDEDRAALAPEGAWTEARADPRCVDGDWVLATGADAAARFEVELPGPGEYRVELRWPRARITARSLSCRVGDRDPWRVDPRRSAHRWVALGTVSLAERVDVVVRSGDGGSFALDALRLVEVETDAR